MTAPPISQAIAQQYGLRPRGRQPLTSGPWKGVRNTTDPFDDPPDLLVDAQNIVIPDPVGGSGAYARPGWTTAGAWYNTLSPGYYGQRAYTHVTLGGTVYTFLFAGNIAGSAGKVYRVASDWSTIADVTPAGVTISPTGRIHCASYLGNLIVSDGVNTPWYVADSGLGATPLVATKIFLDAANTAWAALCGPVVYSGALFFVLGGSSAIGSIQPGVGLAWSEPGTPQTGYNQTGYADFWNLQQTAQGDMLVRALAATNTGLYYFRRRGIGTIVGNPGLGNFSTTATHDTVSTEVGCVAPATIQRFGDDTLFFCDALGRPWRLRAGGAPEPIYLQLRAIVDTNLAITAQTSVTATVGVSAIEPTLQLYLCAPYSAAPSTTKPPTEMEAFDARSGAYIGRQTLLAGYQINTLDTVLDKNIRPTLLAIGSNGTSWSGIAGANNGYVWTLSDPAAGIWTDNGAVPTMYIQTGRQGYSADVVWTADVGTAVVMSQAPVQVTVTTPYTASTLEATPTPGTSSDGTYRATFGLDVVAARGFQVKVSPTTATAQWGIQRVSVDAVPSAAGPEEL